MRFSKGCEGLYSRGGVTFELGESEKMVFVTVVVCLFVGARFVISLFWLIDLTRMVLL